MARVAAATFAVVVSLATACAPATQEAAETCASVNDDLATCLGTEGARLECSAASSQDVTRLRLAMDTIGCKGLAEALPLDGDPKAATCLALGSGCVSAVTAPPAHAPTRYPVVLVNGIDTSPLFRYSERIVRTLRDEGGHAVFLATLPAYEPPHRRTPLLWKRVREVMAQTGAPKVNLVCHSLGGLDCRYLASPRGLVLDGVEEGARIASSVASVTTVGTAHRGTKAADVLLGLAPDWGRGKAIEAFAGLAGDWFSAGRVDDGDPALREALLALSTTQAPAFNGEIADAEGVFYQSWAGVSRPLGRATAAFEAAAEEACRRDEDGGDGRVGFVRHDWMALPLVPFVDVLGDDVPSDGLTPVASARWGTFRGCIPADHMEQLGQKNLPDANVQNGFDVAFFYAGIAADLAARGL